MAEFSLTGAESRYFVPCHWLHNPSIQLPTTPGLLYFSNPRCRRRRKLQHHNLLLASKFPQEPLVPIPSSSELAIIHTHEHSDGSIVFRFGNPSELVKDDQLEIERQETGSKGVSGAVKVLDGDVEKEVIVRKNEREEAELFSSASNVVLQTSEIDDKLIEEPELLQLLVSTTIKDESHSSSFVVDLKESLSMAPSTELKRDLCNRSDVRGVPDEKGGDEAAQPVYPDLSKTEIKISSDSGILGVSGNVYEEGAIEDQEQSTSQNPAIIMELTESSIQLESPSQDVELLGFLEGSEDQSVETGNANVQYEQSSSSNVIDQMHLPPSETEQALGKEADSELLGFLEGSDDQSVETGHSNVSHEETSSSNVIDQMHLPPSETEQVLDKEADSELLGFLEESEDQSVETGHSNVPYEESSSSNVIDQMPLPTSDTEQVLDKDAGSKLLGFLEGSEDQSVEIGNSNVPYEESSSTNVIDQMPLPPSETGQFLDKDADSELLDFLEGSDDQSVEAGNSNVPYEESSSTNVIDQMPLPPSETEQVLDKEADSELLGFLEGSEDQSVETGNSNVPYEECSSTNVIDQMPLPPSETEQFLDKDADSELLDFLEGSEDQSVEIWNSNVPYEESSSTNVIDQMPLPPSEPEQVLDKEADSELLGFLEGSEDQGVETENSNVPHEESSSSNVIDQMPLPPSETEQVLDKEADSELLGFLEGSEDQIVETGNPNVPYEESSSTKVIDQMPLPPSETEQVLDKEADSDTVEEPGEEDIIVTLPMIKDHMRNEISEGERIIHNVQKSDLCEGSDHKLVELKDIDASTDSSQIPTSEFVLSSGAAMLPHPSKVSTGGEDACFISSEKWLGIADGGGRWSLEGMHPGVYAEELMENCKRITSGSNGLMVTKPEEVISLSVAKSQSSGSSTALVAHFSGLVLCLANVGDSGFLILRNGVVYMKSSPMFHEFNFPLQIERGVDPFQLLQGYEVELSEGDVVVMATDGLFDNLYEQEVVATVSKSLEAGKTPKEIAEHLATRAQEVGKSATARSPFADAAHAAGYVNYAGGKLDDVAVIVSLVEKQPVPFPSRSYQLC